MGDSPQMEQVAEEASSEAMIHFPPPVAESAPTTHRYPQRVHVPPDRLSYK